MSKKLLMIDSIYNKEIRNFVELILKEKPLTEKQEKDAYEVFKWVLFILRNDKILTSENPGYAAFIDVLKAASIVHNLYTDYSDKDFSKLFLLRIHINENKKILSSIQKDIIESVCQVVESQLGKYNPVSLLVPNPNTPGSQFALACSLYYKAKSRIDEKELEEFFNNEKSKNNK